MSKLQKIKEILFGTEAPVDTPEVKFIDIQSGDIMLRIDPAVEVDAAVAQVIIAEDGTEAIEPIADGEYSIMVEEMEMILVIENSVITAINEPIVEEEEVVEEEMENQFEVETNAKIEGLQNSLNDLLNKIETLNFASQIEAMEVKLAEIAKAPGAVEIKLSKQAQEIKNKRESESDKFEALRKLRK